MSDAAHYTPRPGSKAEAAALVLGARGKLSTAALADELDVESGTLSALLSVPLKWGYLARERRRDGINWWRMGDGTPLAAEPDDDPPVQRIGKASGRSAVDLDADTRDLPDAVIAQLSAPARARARAASAPAKGTRRPTPKFRRALRLHGLEQRATRRGRRASPATTSSAGRCN